MSGFDHTIYRINRANVRLLHRLLDVLARELANERDPSALIAGRLLRSQLEKQLKNAQALVDRNRGEVVP